jgi:DNA-binding YbaB/EbfC family protein
VFKGLGNLANFAAVIKQVQEMGGRVQAIQQELKGKRTTGAAGGGLVEIDVNGLAEVQAVRIEPSLIAKGDREMIEDLLPVAFNAAQQKARELQAEAYQSLTGGLPVGGFPDALSQILGSGEGDQPT